MFTVQFFHLYCMLKNFIIKCWGKYLSNVNNKERKKRRKGHRREERREKGRQKGKKKEPPGGRTILHQ